MVPLYKNPTKWGIFFDLLQSWRLKDFRWNSPHCNFFIKIKSHNQKTRKFDSEMVPLKILFELSFCSALSGNSTVPWNIFRWRCNKKPTEWGIFFHLQQSEYLKFHSSSDSSDCSILTMIKATNWGSLKNVSLALMSLHSRYKVFCILILTFLRL